MCVLLWPEPEAGPVADMGSPNATPSEGIPSVWTSPLCTWATPRQRTEAWSLPPSLPPLHKTFDAYTMPESTLGPGRGAKMDEEPLPWLVLTSCSNLKDNNRGR